MHPRPWFWRMTVLTGVFTLAIAVILVRAANSNNLSAIQNSVSDYRLMGSAIRLCLITIFATFWPQILVAASRRNYLASETARHLLEHRWRFVAWLVAAELLIGTNAVNAIANAARAVPL